jgi:photosystem II stability/assembly factor-like uncharacterized protein
VGGVAWFPPENTTTAQWQPRSANLPLSSVTALTKVETLLLAGGAEGIALSRDGGFHWQQARLEDGVASVTAFAISPRFSEDQTAVAATLANGVLRSDDGGYTWTNATFGLESTEVTALVWSSGSTLLAAASDGLYRSSNAGRAWRRVYKAEEMGVDAIAMLPGGALLATLDGGGLLRSDDGGAHWSVDEAMLRDMHVVSLLVSANKTVLAGTTEQGLLRSTDQGATWQVVHTGNALSLAATQTMLYAGTEDGVCISEDDGCTWRELPCPPVHDLRHLFIHDQQPYVMGPYTGIVHAALDATWSSIANLPQPLTATAVAPDGALLLAGPDGLVRTSDAGQTQQTVIAGETGRVAHITFRPQGSTWHGWVGSADGRHVLRSRDAGATWQPLPAPFGILPLVALQAVPDCLFAATYDTRQYRVCIWYSVDDGETWERSAEAETRWPLVATCEQPALVSVANVLLQQHGSPGQWQKMAIGNDGSMIRRIISVQQERVTVLLVLNTTGIQRSEDAGATWRRDDAGLPLEQVRDIAATDTTLYALLDGGQVWQRAL